MFSSQNDLVPHEQARREHQTLWNCRDVDSPKTVSPLNCWDVSLSPFCLGYGDQEKIRKQNEDNSYCWNLLPNTLSNEETICNWYLLGKKKIRFLQCSEMGYINHIAGKPLLLRSSRIIHTHKKSQCLFGFVLFLFGLCFCCCCCWLPSVASNCFSVSAQLVGKGIRNPSPFHDVMFRLLSLWWSFEGRWPTVYQDTKWWKMKFKHRQSLLLLLLLNLFLIKKHKNLHIFIKWHMMF